MHVKGVMGSLDFDGEWITITKTRVGSATVSHRLRAADLTGTTLKPGSLLFHGYVQFLVPGTLPAPTNKGVMAGGRPTADDPNSLSIPKSSNSDAEKFVAAVEGARTVNP